MKNLNELSENLVGFMIFLCVIQIVIIFFMFLIMVPGGKHQLHQDTVDGLTELVSQTEVLKADVEVLKRQQREMSALLRSGFENSENSIPQFVISETENLSDLNTEVSRLADHVKDLEPSVSNTNYDFGKAIDRIIHWFIWPSIALCWISSIVEALFPKSIAKSYQLASRLRNYGFIGKAVFVIAAVSYPILMIFGYVETLKQVTEDWSDAMFHLYAPITFMLVLISTVLKFTPLARIYQIAIAVALFFVMSAGFLELYDQTGSFNGLPVLERYKELIYKWFTEVFWNKHGFVFSITLGLILLYAIQLYAMWRKASSGNMVSES